jgi:hypothetical protein
MRRLVGRGRGRRGLATLAVAAAGQVAALAAAALTAALTAALGAPLMAQPPASAAAPHRPRLHVLSIGIEDYRDPDLRQRGAAADAQAVHDSLVALSDGLYIVRGQVLVGPAATAPAVRAALRAVAAAVRPGDVVVLYYRGLASPRFLVLADSTALPAPAAPGAAPPPAFEARLLRADSLAHWLATLPTRQQLVILDAPNGAAFFQTMQPQLRAAPGAREALRDLTAIALPGLPIAAPDARGAPHTVLGLALLQALGAERREAPIRLASALATRVLESLQDPVMIYESGADLVLGASAHPLARANAQALRDPRPWTPTCAAPSAPLRLLEVRNTITLVGSAAGLPTGARLFVNGRRARFAGEAFEVELPPAAAAAPVRIRVLLPDGCRFEVERALP